MMRPVTACKFHLPARFWRRREGETSFHRGDTHIQALSCAYMLAYLLVRGGFVCLLCNQRILNGWLGAVVGAWSTCPLVESVRRSGSCHGGSVVFKVRGANHSYQVLVVLPSSVAFSQTVSMPDT